MIFFYLLFSIFYPLGDFSVEGQTSPSKTSSLRALSDEFAKAAEKVKPSVVSVRTTSVAIYVDPHDFFFGPGPSGQPRSGSQEIPRGMGSGILIPGDYILTNNHVIQGAKNIYVTLANGRQMRAKVIGTDSKSDVAVVKLSEASRLSAAELGDSDSVRVGDWVLAVGNPFGLDQTVTVGIISAKGRGDVKITDYGDFIQTDVAINPGNSGGALVDLDGKVIGMNTAIVSRSGGYEGVGFAIPVNMARTIMESLIKDGKVTRGYLGVQLHSMTRELAEMLGFKEAGGLVVAGVEPASPAEKAGLQARDVVTRFNGKELDSPRHFSTLVKTAPIGQEVELTVVRDGREQLIKIRIGAATPEIVAADTLGIEVATLDRVTAERYGYQGSAAGVVITRVDPNSRAASIGLQEGDLIVGINNQKIQNAKTYGEAIDKLSDSKKILLNVVRGRRYFYAVLPLK